MSCYYGPAQIREFTEGLTPGTRVSQRLRWADASGRILGQISIREATVVSVEPGGHGRVCQLDDGSTYQWAFPGLYYMARDLKHLGSISDPLDERCTAFLHPGDQDHDELTRRERLKDALSAAERSIFDPEISSNHLYTLELATQGLS